MTALLTGSEVLTAPEAVEKHFVSRGQGLEFEMEAGWIRRRLPRYAGRVIDVGCGNGSLFPYLAVPCVVGMDYQFEGLRLTRRRFPSVPTICATAEAIPLSDDSADAVTLQHVIEHLPDPMRACTEWKRVLRPGGRLLILTPNAEFEDPSVFDDPTHRELFDATRLKKLMKTCGFIVRELCTIGLPWLRSYRRIPCGWRLRRFTIRHAAAISALPSWRWSGQTLCCAAVRPVGP